MTKPKQTEAEVLADIALKRYHQRVRETVEELGLRRASMFLRMSEEEIRDMLQSPGLNG